MLHEMSGPVVHGRGKGARAGFPTANLALKGNETLPPYGVYATRVYLSDGVYFGVTGVGSRPTADDGPEATVETWLPDFRGDLYGETIRVEFLLYLREIRRFADMGALKEQIDRDAEQAKAFLARFPDASGYLTFSPEETRALAARAAERLRGGSVLALRGDMGAGKSEFSRGIARGLGITGPVPSPSFTILNVYDEGRLPLYHFDWYRVQEEDELFEIGAQEYLGGEGVALVEWAERAEDLLPARRLEVLLRPLDGSTRLITFAPAGGEINPLPGKEPEPC